MKSTVSTILTVAGILIAGVLVHLLGAVIYAPSSLVVQTVIAVVAVMLSFPKVNNILIRIAILIGALIGLINPLSIVLWGFVTLVIRMIAH
jgi:hypothetical protein